MSQLNLSGTFSRSNLFNAVGIGMVALSGAILALDSTWVSTGRAGMAFLMASVCLFFGNLDRLKSFKASASGLEAETREIVARAEVSLAQLQRLAIQLSALAIESNAAAGRWDSGSSIERDRRRQAALEVLIELKVPDDQITAVAASDRKWVLVDYLHTLMNVCFLIPPDGGQIAGAANAAEMFNTMLTGYGERDEEPPPAASFLPQLRKILISPQPILERWIASYETYRAKGQHGEPALWARRDEYNLALILQKQGTPAPPELFDEFHST